ncbi:SHOCT domain-containing protein [Chlorobaculum limnaeum]|nr:SHOCT domain-containing protein [Chlorobaculum limnaeum]
MAVSINRGMVAGNARRELSSSPARQILDEQYVKGEIDKQQYEQIKKDIL